MKEKRYSIQHAFLTGLKVTHFKHPIAIFLAGALDPALHCGIINLLRSALRGRRQAPKETV